jgi:hypothetical protein
MKRTWMMRNLNGELEEIPLSEMSDSHLCNAIRKVRGFIHLTEVEQLLSPPALNGYVEAKLRTMSIRNGWLFDEARKRGLMLPDGQLLHPAVPPATVPKVAAPKVSWSSHPAGPKEFKPPSAMTAQKMQPTPVQTETFAGGVDKARIMMLERALALREREAAQLRKKLVSIELSKTSKMFDTPEPASPVSAPPGARAISLKEEAEE